MGKITRYYCDKCGAESEEKVFLLTVERYRISRGPSQGEEYTLLRPNPCDHYGKYRLFKKKELQLCTGCIEKLSKGMEIKLFERWKKHPPSSNEEE